VCARGDGIRRSKDLRAGLRKYLRPTNERKKMSKKTNFKRIALVAVASLSFGVLTSIAPANAANVAYVSGTTGGLSGGSSGTACAVAAESGAALTLAAITTTSASTNLTSIVMPLGARITLLVADSGDVAKSTGSVLLEDSTALTISNGGRTFTAAGDADVVTVYANAVGSGTVSNFGTTSSAISTVNFTVVASCANDTWSDTYSLWEINTAEDSTPTLTTSVFTFVDEDVAYVSLVGKNAYNAILPAGTWIATTTEGSCLLDLNASAATVTTLSQDSLTGTAGTNIYAAVAQATEGAAVACPVKITYNGATVWNKTINFTGDAATITVSGVDVQKASDSSLTGIYDVVVKDAAGNQLAWDIAGDSTKYDQIVTSVTGGTTSTSSATLAASSWACTANKSGKTSVRVKATTNAGTTIYSNAFDALCGNDAYTYTASLDKASYVPGDLATLTITAKDASGNAPYKTETVGAVVAPEISGSQMTPVATPTTSDTFNASGVKTYTFTVGPTAGKYNMTVNLGYAGNSPVTAGYAVVSSGTTNEDILKSIVSLIASINKQIQALQKLILKR
jgi:trimeric autotransporter adhesin